MQAWGGGYVTDLEYESGFFPGQTPRLMSLAAAMNGVEAPDFGNGFAYCELGCGRGETSLALAAMHPAAEFHAVDFNPAHIAYAQDRATAAGLDNVTFYERSFSDLTGPHAISLPMFDAVTLHGVWTWISPALQDDIVSFIEAKLKPGGLVYISYNAMPGWADIVPVQRLLKELADASGRRSDQAIEQAMGYLTRLAKGAVGGPPTRLPEGLKTIQDMFEQGRGNVAVHEYLNEHWKPLFHLDVARALGRAKLTLAASTDLLLNFQNMSLTAEQASALSDIPSPDLRETLKDFCANVKFRRDVYVRGARRISASRRDAMFRDLMLALVRRPPEAFHLNMPDGSSWRPDPAVYLPVLEKIRSRPSRVGDLLAAPYLPHDHKLSPVELVGLLVGGSLVAPYSAPTPDALAASARLVAATYAAEPTPRYQVPVAMSNRYCTPRWCAARRPTLACLPGASSTFAKGGAAIPSSMGSRSKTKPKRSSCLRPITRSESKKRFPFGAICKWSDGRQTQLIIVMPP
jgi:SAM-dependent methyltransferase